MGVTTNAILYRKVYSDVQNKWDDNNNNKTDLLVTPGPPPAYMYMYALSLLLFKEKSEHT